jgi:hypothetical protein
MSTDVARHFAPSSGEADERDVAQVERLDHRRQIIRIVIHVIAFPWLARAPMSSAIVRNHAIAFVGEKDHLRFQLSELSGQPWLNVTTGPLRRPQSL